MSQLLIHLPSGRRLSYARPRIEENAFGGESVTYLGTDVQKKWTRIESYGPKLVENIVQAISRDVLAGAMRYLTLAHPECAIVAHVHDEVILEAPESTTTETICREMGMSPEWLPGIELKAEGYSCPYYMKQ